MYLLFHNPRCSKSRTCLKILIDKKLNFKEVQYLKEGLNLSTLSDIVNKLENPLSDLIRTNEKEFKLEPFDMNKKKLIITFLNKFPICLQRPLFFNGKHYVVCRPPQTVLKYI